MHPGAPISLLFAFSNIRSIKLILMSKERLNKTDRNLFSFIGDLIEYGTEGVTDEEERIRIMAVNRLALAAGSSLIVIIPTLCSFLSWDRSILIPLVSEFFLNASVLYWNRKKRYNTAACLLYFLQVVVIPFYGFKLGKLLQLELTIVLLIAISFLIFKKSLLRKVAIGGAILDLICLEVWYYTHPDLKFDLSFNAIFITQLLVVVAITGITLAVSYPYVKRTDLSYELERANHFIKIFIAQVTHELRTPLNVIHQIAQLLKKASRKDKMLQPIEQYIDITLAETKSAKNIVNNVLSMTEIESGKLEKINKSIFAVRSLFDSIVEGKRVIAKVENMQINLVIDEKMPPAIITDPMMVEQITTNLLANAIKYGRDKTIIRLSVLKEAEDKWIIQVANEGVGIPPNKIKSIFDPFYTGSNGYIEGTGLGLYIVKNKVTALGGKIRVESIPNDQTIFTIMLPLTAGKLSSITPYNNDQDPAPDIQGIHVLLVDDDKLSAIMLAIHLDEIGCKVTTVSDGMEVVNAVKRIMPDVILMDYHMPGMNGVDATRILKTDPSLRDIPIIVTTGDLYSNSVEKMLEAGADAYMEKPVDVRPLQEAISRQIAKKMRD